MRLHYPAGATLPDSEGILFRHSGTMKHVVHRPPVKTGSMRIATGPEEHHTAENASATSAVSLRIQLKTVKNARSRSRIPAGTFRGESATSVEFTSEAFVIPRVFVAPGQSITAEAVGAPAPSLWISVPSGETRWADATPETVTNNGPTPMELVRVIVR